MSKKLRILFLTIALTVLTVDKDGRLATSTGKHLAVFGSPSSDVLLPAQVIGLEEVPRPPRPSCAHPLPANKSNCEEIERAILASSVRILMYTPPLNVKGIDQQVIRGAGHATVMEGRYLVTHNHLDAILVALLRQGDPQNLITINVMDAAGRLVLRVPAQSVSLTSVDPVSVVLDFGLVNGRGLFEALGFLSARFVSPTNAMLAPGTEVAQLNWDGWTSHVQWTTIESVQYESEIASVKLADCLESGASGGGLFLKSAHIGNNWKRSGNCAMGGTASGYSIAALNLSLPAEPKR